MTTLLVSQGDLNDKENYPDIYYMKSNDDNKECLKQMDGYDQDDCIIMQEKKQ